MKKARSLIVASLDDIRAGRKPAPHCDAETPRLCEHCGAQAVLPLDPETRMAQPDATTHVCHPVLGGCNQGWTVYDVDGAVPASIADKVPAKELAKRGIGL